MSIETIYFKAAPNDEFEQGMSRLANYAGCTAADDRRTFLTTLAQAVGRSEAILTIGQLALLSSVLSRGLGAELAPVDWNALGLTPQDVLLPQGALPLVVDGHVAGMILENAGQCIIAINNEENDLDKLCELYVLPYLMALHTTPVAAQEQPEAAQPEELTDQPQPDEMPDSPLPQQEDEKQAEETAEEAETPLPVIEGNVDKIDVKAPTQAPSSIETMMQNKPIDIFNDMELTEEEIDSIVPPRNWRPLRSFIIFIVIFALLVGGGFFGYNQYLAPRQYDKASAEALDAFQNNHPDEDVFSNKHFSYNTDFSSLYRINDNVVAWLEVEGLGLKTPVVSSANRSETYYNDHIFDKTFNPYGTAFINGIYDKSNEHVNFVIRGKSKDDSRLFSGLTKYLESSFALQHHTFTVQTVYDDEPTEWEIFSVLTFSEDDSPYLNNFTSLTGVQRQEIIRKALEESNVNFSVDEVNYLNDMGTYRYTTLVTNYRGGYLAVMARNVQKASNAAVTQVQTTPQAANSTSK